MQDFGQRPAIRFFLGVAGAGFRASTEVSLASHTGRHTGRCAWRFFAQRFGYQTRGSQPEERDWLEGERAREQSIAILVRSNVPIMASQNGSRVNHADPGSPLFPSE